MASLLQSYNDPTVHLEVPSLPWREWFCTQVENLSFPEGQMCRMQDMRCRTQVSPRNYKKRGCTAAGKAHQLPLLPPPSGLLHYYMTN